MDWDRAIEINRIALGRIVAQIYALLGLVRGSTVERLPHRLYVAAERLLRPAESALRRLIVIAARGLVVKPSQTRTTPKRLIIPKASQSVRTSFKLFDSRKRFNFTKPGHPLYVIVQTYNTFPNPIFNPPPIRRSRDRGEGMPATRFCKRLAAVALALETLPHQALRMARWQAKRQTLKNPKFTSPLRPGRPPGFREKPKAEIDYILRECHALANDVIRGDTS